MHILRKSKRCRTSHHRSKIDRLISIRVCSAPVRHGSNSVLTNTDGGTRALPRSTLLAAHDMNRCARRQVRWLVRRVLETGEQPGIRICGSSTQRADRQSTATDRTTAARIRMRRAAVRSFTGSQPGLVKPRTGFGMTCLHTADYQRPPYGLPGSRSAASARPATGGGRSSTGNGPVPDVPSKLGSGDVLGGAGGRSPIVGPVVPRAGSSVQSISRSRTPRAGAGGCIRQRTRRGSCTPMPNDGVGDCGRP